MANSKANIMQIPLNSALNLNKVDSDIKQFSGFNKNNAPVLGGCLSTLYKKELNADSNAIVDKDGNIISYDPESKYFKKNGQNWIYNSHQDTEVLIRKEAKFWNEYTGEEVPSGEVVAAIPYDEENVYDYVLWNEKEGKLYLCYYYVENDVVLHSFEVKSNVSTLPTLGLYRDGSLLFVSSFGVVKGNVFAPLNFKFDSFNAVKIGNYYYLGSKREFSRFGLNGSLDKTCVTVVIDNSASPFVSPATSFFCFNVVNQKAYLYFYEEFRFASSGQARHALAIDVEDISHYQGSNAHIDASNVIYTTSMTNFDAKPFTDSIRSQVKASLYSSTAEKHFYLGWWDDIKLTVKGHNKYADGFAQMITKRGFSFLYNSDELSGISKNGVLLTEWFSINSYFPVNAKDNRLIYKDANTNKIIIVSSVSDWTKAQYKTFGNKLFTNFGNGTYLDLEEGKIGRAFVDFNGRLPCSPSNTNDIATADTRFIATGINQDFANNKEQIISMLINPTTITREQASNLNLFVPASDVLLDVDVYVGSTNPLYSRTISDDVGNIRSFSVIKPEKEGLEWTSDTGGNLIITPSVFSSFINSGLNMDLIKEGKDTYRLLNYNNRQVLGFYLNSLMENVQNVFVIQGNAYAIIDSLIYSYDVQNGVNVGSMPIVDIHDLQFLASTPYKAYFYSPLTQSVLSFNGSNTLNYEFTATKINEVFDSIYNPDTLSIIFTSDTDLIFVTNFGMYSIPKLSLANDEKIFVTKKGLAVVYPTIGRVQFLRYTKNLPGDAENFEKINIELETCFYGLENQKMSVNDCVYLRLFDEEKNAGRIEISATTISLSTKETDKTIISVKPSDWDKESKTLFVRYQPKRQRGLGTSFKIKSPFNIVSMAIGNIPDANLIDNMSKGTNIDW